MFIPMRRSRPNDVIYVATTSGHDRDSDIVELTYH